VDWHGRLRGGYGESQVNSPVAFPSWLRQPLPAIRIPLRETDEDVRLDLQAILEQTYRGITRPLTTTRRLIRRPGGDDARWRKRSSRRRRSDRCLN
jgi:hypothetical protein